MRDYGRKPYLNSKLSYPQSMQVETDSARQWAHGLEKHSEMKKPYRGQPYQQMEYMNPYRPFHPDIPVPQVPTITPAAPTYVLTPGAYLFYRAYTLSPPYRIYLLADFDTLEPLSNVFYTSVTELARYPFIDDAHYVGGYNLVTIDVYGSGAGYLCAHVRAYDPPGTMYEVYNNGLFTHTDGYRDLHWDAALTHDVTPENYGDWYIWGQPMHVYSVCHTNTSECEVAYYVPDQYFSSRKDDENYIHSFVKRTTEAYYGYYTWGYGYNPCGLPTNPPLTSILKTDYYLNIDGEEILEATGTETSGATYSATGYHAIFYMPKVYVGSYWKTAVVVRQSYDNPTDVAIIYKAKNQVGDILTKTYDTGGLNTGSPNPRSYHSFGIDYMGDPLYGFGELIVGTY
jgi:hypothetical protein